MDQITGNKQIIDAFFDAGNRGDLDTCFSLMSNEIKWTDIGSTRFSGTYEGKDALVDQLLGPLFGQLKAGIASTVDNMIAESDFVVTQSRGRAETHDGQAYNNTYCHVFRLRDGLIIAVTEYLDTELVTAVFGP